MRSFLFILLLATFACCHLPSPSNRNIETNTLQDRATNAIRNWQNLDLQTDGVFGISTNKAYAQLLKNKTAKTIIVAVIDSGVDTTREELKTVLWTDPNDGSHGRNYIGAETGKEDFIPMLAITPGTSSYSRILDDYNLHVTRLQTFMTKLEESKKILEQIVKNLGQDNPSFENIKSYHPRNEGETMLINLLLDRMPFYTDFKSLRFNEVDHLLELGKYHLEHALNKTITSKADTISVNNKPEGIDANVSSDPLGLIEVPNVSPFHGTHMAGIIAAVRKNDNGIDGICDHVRIMMLKLNNNIREMRNDNLAAAIRFAVDHGARVISMSFGKTFSWHRGLVDESVRSAMSRNVLIVHSSGNDGMNLDVAGNSFFPSARYFDGGIASAWITVGASGYHNDSTLAEPFSNYGQNNVDVFAPGVQITSTIPHSGYAAWDGTSEATPIVAGLAALIMEYYPTLTSVQVKEIIIKSAAKTVWLRDKCVSGGVVNAYYALKLAEEYK